MISNVDVNVGEMYLDKGYLSRANAQLIADIGAVPYIAIKSNVKILWLSCMEQDG